MTQPFKVLYIGAVDPSALEPHSRAVRLAGGTFIRYEGHDTAALTKAVSDVDVAILQGSRLRPSGSGRRDAQRRGPREHRVVRHRRGVEPHHDAFSDLLAEVRAARPSG